MSVQYSGSVMFQSSPLCRISTRGNHICFKGKDNCNAVLLLILPDKQSQVLAETKRTAQSFRVTTTDVLVPCSPTAFPLPLGQ